MNAKFFLATLAASAVSFFAGWVIFGVLFTEFYGSGMNEAAMSVTRKPPLLWAIAISNIAWSLLLTWVLQKTGNLGFGKGFATSLWISFLVALTFDLSMYGFYDVYSSMSFIAIDIAVSSIFWGIVGGISGAILGANRKS